MDRANLMRTTDTLLLASPLSVFSTFCQRPLCNMADDEHPTAAQLRLCSATAEAMDYVGGLADCKLVVEDGSGYKVSKGLIAAHSKVLGCVVSAYCCTTVGVCPPYASQHHSLCGKGLKACHCLLSGD
jgi:hypothetical protein